MKLVKLLFYINFYKFYGSLKQAICLFLVLSLTNKIDAQSISQYRPVLLLLQPKEKSGPTTLAIRSFWKGSQLMYLVVHPDSLYTYVGLAADYISIPTDWNFLLSNWASKPYMKALHDAIHNDSRLQNAGLVHLKDPEPGISLTIDLCPSRLPIDRRVFNALVQSDASCNFPIPVSLSISGKWLANHKDDLTWLKSLSDQKVLEITWINHTLNHPWNPSLPLYENFLLEQGTNISKEVLGNEELLLEHGLIPSCFFRFPGLISDKFINDQITDWGLVPIGSDAWLAKGQYPKASGSIVLIHANGHDPIGIHSFLQLLQLEKEKLKMGQWRLIDLREELEKE